jgi:arabinofuranosyltransferase
MLVGGDFMPGLRLVLPVFGIAVAALCAMGWNARHAARPYALGAVAVLLVFIMTARWLDADTRKKMGYWRGYAPLRTNIGLWLHHHAPPGSLVAVNAAGMIAYYSELPCLDMLGINNRYVPRHGRRDPTLPVGHQLGDGRYVLNCQPDFLFVTSDNRAPGIRTVADREINTSPIFHREYERCRMRLTDGQVYVVFRRKDARAGLREP